MAMPPGDAEMNPSITPATSRQTTAAPIILTATRPASTSASPRVSSPGATIAWPSSRPAAPATQTAKSSSAPCPMMNSSR
jgi:hypothetical protein